MVTVHEIQQKPSWRGWLHAGSAPLVLIAGIILVALAPGTAAKIACAIYVATGVLLFGTSALYHRGNWSPKTSATLKRLDHSNIMLVIAGSYTPLSFLMLARPTATLLLWMIWIGAIAGVLFRVLWVRAPRWLYVPIYVLLGITALFFLPEFWAAGALPTVLICLGGALYIAGAVIYGIKKPNFSARHFGFHELFHALTVAAFAIHFTAVVLVVFK
ncbi:MULTISPECIES: PAQR family membrane homeostasis protein TrhA [Arthrobacter]|uniref:PAQR family membrane homeostasis protein TrhA n=1 Tax=unclassified Arthrobacter TaxID=235627 RepID=UPI0024BB129B|nr:hemolysin III family protein [Arthrobacter sp. H35-MC1]MDJ0317217.1 hemolysin III family protein [Arthrobacter sp. H35-MC1]